MQHMLSNFVSFMQLLQKDPNNCLLVTNVASIKPSASSLKQTASEAATVGDLIVPQLSDSDVEHALVSIAQRMYLGQHVRELP